MNPMKIMFWEDKEIRKNFFDFFRTGASSQGLEKKALND